MDTLTPHAPDSPRRTLLGSNAPAVFLAGIVLLGTSLLLLGLLANAVERTEFEEVGPPTVSNGTATLTYAITGTFSIPRHSYVDGAYHFPVAVGDAYVLDCWDYADLAADRPVSERALVIRGRTEGHLNVPVADVVRPPRPPTPGASPPWSSYCPGLYLAFQWPATPGWEANRPMAFASVASSPLGDSPLRVVLPALALLGGVASISGGLAWRQARAAPVRGPAAGDESTAETLLLVAERAETWLARTRRYLLLAGVLGIFLWYPVIVPWAWRLGQQPGTAAGTSWAAVAAALALLVGLTALWAREFLRLDRELTEWRERLAALRRREAELMAELEA